MMLRCRDTLLLEAGFLTMIVAPLGLRVVRSSWFHRHDGITFWLIKWLAFRLMFCSGVVKLLSNCPTWWGLTGNRSRIFFSSVFIVHILLIEFLVGLISCFNFLSYLLIFLVLYKNIPDVHWYFMIYANANIWKIELAI